MSLSHGTVGWTEDLDDDVQESPSTSVNDGSRYGDDGVAQATSHSTNRLEKSAWLGSSSSEEEGEDSDGRPQGTTSGGWRKKNDHPELPVRPVAKSRASHRQERREIHEALEHLMIVGNAWRHHAWRLSQWRSKARPEQILQRRRGLKQRRLVHPRDHREYSHVKIEPVSSTSPETDKLLQTWDDQWDEACFGDGVRLEQFYDRSLNGKVDPGRLLLLRSWERAMSIASNTIPATLPLHETIEAPSMGAERSETSGLGSSANQPLAATQPRSPRLLTRSMAAKQCQLLELDLDDDPNALTCRTCAVSFETRRRVLDHYYGDNKVRGCCWILIRRKQQQLIRRALEDEAENQSRRLVRSLSGQLQQQRQEIEPWDWQDVLEALDRSLQGSEVDPGGLLSNRAIDAAARRLAERYADVPR